MITATQPEKAGITMEAATQLMDLDLDLLDPNPWQPRVSMDPDYIKGLGDDILAVGLLHEPMARPSPKAEGRYQLAHGHSRVEAMRGLRDAGKGEKTCPIKVKDLTDVEMATIALSENRKRKNLTPAEEIAAWAKVLREIEGVTIQGLADKIGVDRSTMSKNLAILDLPRSVLDLVSAEKMSVRAAREFLALRNADHCHTDMIDLVLEDLGGRESYYSGTSKPADYRTKTVRASIRGLASGSSAYSGANGFYDVGKKWRPLFEGGNHGRTISFDVEEFKAEFPAHVHILPDGDESGGREYTCLTKAWASWSAKATREATKTGTTKSGEPAAKKGKKDEDSDWWKQVKRDPVVQEVVGSRLRGMKSVKDLTEDDIKALGTRVQEVKGQDGIDLPQEAQPEGVTIRNGGRFPSPPMFDFGPCASCTEGAAWYVPPSYYGEKPRLVCTNKKEWQDKRSVAMQQWVAWKDGQIESDAQADRAAIERLPRASFLPGDARALVMSMWAFFREPSPVEPLSGRQTGWDERTRYNYWPAGAEAFAELTGLELPEATNEFHWRSDAWQEKAADWFNNAAADFPWSRALACLQVWQARARLGLGHDIWETVAMATETRVTETEADAMAEAVAAD